MTAAPIIPAPLVDWAAILIALRREGYTLRDVATLTGVPYSTLTSWQAGSSPRHQDGETLIESWSEATQPPREAVPVSQRTGARLYGVR